MSESWILYSVEVGSCRQVLTTVQPGMQLFCACTQRAVAGHGYVNTTQVDASLGCTW